jgi:hypothetical protein
MPKRLKLDPHQTPSLVVSTVSSSITIQLNGRATK